MQNHVFQIEKLRKITLYGVLLLVFLILGLVLLLQTSYFQTKITKYITKEISEQLNTEIDIDNVKISLFRGFIFKGINIQDQQKDTLLYIKELSIIPRGLQTDFNNLDLKEIIVDSMYLNIYNVGEDSLNLQYIIDALSPTDEKSNEDFRLKTDNISILNSQFSYNTSDTLKKLQINFQDLDFDSLNIAINNFEINKQNISGEVENIFLKDKCGFKLNRFSTNKLNISPNHIYFNDFTIETPNSKLVFDSLKLDFPDYYDFSEYKTKLKNNISIRKSSYLSYNDIRYFINDTNTYSEKVQISGKINGTYDKFDIKRLIVKHEGLIDLNLDLEVKDFSDFENPSFFVKVKKFNLNFQKLQDIKIAETRVIIDEIPEGLKNIENISYAGATKGKLSKFITRGKFSGSFGDIEVIALTKRDSLALVNVKGKLSGTKVKINQALQNNDFGTMNFNQKFDFSYLKSKKIKLKTSGKIDEITYKKYTYKNIDLYADLYDKKIDSLSVYINQNDIKAKLVGNVDFVSTIPKVKLTVNVIDADLKTLNINNAENNSNIKFDLFADFEGLNIDDFTGMIKLTDSLSYSMDTVNIIIEKFKLTGNLLDNISPVKKSISLRSDVADIDFTTENKLSQTLKSIKSLTIDLFKSKRILNENEIDTGLDSTGLLVLEANLKKPKIISSLIFPEYHISKNTSIYGFYDPKNESLNLSLNSKKLKYKKFIVNDFYIIAYTKNKKLYGGTGGSSLQPNKNVYVENINLEGDLLNDTINFNLNWNNFKDSTKYSADISGIVEMKKKDNNKTYYNCIFDNSKITMNDEVWDFNNANVIMDSTQISIIDLIFTNNNQKIYLDGNISEYPGDILYSEFTNFKLSNLQPLVSKDFIINGELNGSTTLAQLYEKPLIFTKDSIISMSLNNIDFGNFYFKSNWDDLENKIHVNAYNLKGKHKQFMNDTIYGDYWPATNQINLTADIRSMLLKTFKDYYQEFAAFNPSSYVTGEIDVFGNIKEPKIKGDLKLKQTTVLVNYLNTYYNFDDLGITISNNNIKINETKISSKNKGSSGHLKGNISHNNFSDFKIDIDIDSKNLQLMKLGRTDSSYFYGTAFGTGNINLSGPFNNIKLDANLSTEKETYIFIPISTSEILEEEKSFIQFVKDTSRENISTKNENYALDFSGFTMNMKIDVTPDAEIQIIQDNSGDIKTKGDGSLLLTLDNEGDFKMFGNFIISEGTYELDLKAYPEEFQIEEGSKIIWSGNPEDALVNINAYQIVDDVPLNTLVPQTTEGEDYSKSDINCSLSLIGKLLNPTLSFNIQILESVSPMYSGKIDLFDERELLQQFIALIIVERFIIGDDGLEIKDSSPLTGNLLSSQLNDLLKLITDDVEFEVILESENKNKSSKQGAVVYGTLLDNWVSYKGGVSKGGNEIGTEENIVGEFEFEVKLNSKGTLKAKAYNKAANKFENEGDYTQGVGLMWKKKFDSFFFWKRREEKDSVKIILDEK